MLYRAPRGTNDILPDEVARWQHLESTFRNIVELYGYQEIRTPIFESTDLFIRSSGDTSEIVEKQMYTFLDKGGRSISLKPEGTAPVIRACIEHKLLSQSSTSRLWYFTPIFRYERPQKGRYRQAHQCGLELLGAKDAMADVEVMRITYEFYQNLGIQDVEVRVNSIGRKETRNTYQAALLDHVSGWLKDQSDEQKARTDKNPLRLLDSKEPELIELLKEAPSILDHLEPESADHFDEVKQGLSDQGVPFVVDHSIVRGLDYYTDTVFEVISNQIGAQGALCGGGRYDDLVEQMGGPSTPAVGVAMGIERALIATQDIQPPVSSRLVVVIAATEDRSAIDQTLDLLRSGGIPCTSEFSNAPMKKQFKEADRLGARLAVVVGDDEIANGSLTVKDMISFEQKSLDTKDALAHIRKLLS